MPNYDQVTGALRAIVPVVIALLADNKISDPWISGLVIVAATAISVAWSYLNNKSGKIVGQ